MSTHVLFPLDKPLLIPAYKKLISKKSLTILEWVFESLTFILLKQVKPSIQLPYFWLGEGEKRLYLYNHPPIKIESIWCIKFI